MVNTAAASELGQRAAPPSLSTLICQYHVSNSVEGKSAITVEWYSQILSLFISYLESRGLADDLSSINVSTAREYILYLRQRNKLSRYPGKASPILSPKTIQCHVRALKAFCSWLYRERLISINHLSELKIPKAPRKMIEPLTPGEINRIMLSIDLKKPMGLRNYSLLVLMLDTGLRSSEVCSLTLGHLNLEKGYLKVLGKGAKERLIPFGQVVTSTLRNYIQESRSKDVSQTPNNLFLTDDQKSMSPNALKLIFDRLAKSSGVSRLHPHLCRHTFATNYLFNGGDVFSLKEILGHTTLDMVNEYLHFTTAQISAQHHRFSPMDKLKHL